MKEHLDTVCSKTVIKCKYSEFDCEYEVMQLLMFCVMNKKPDFSLIIHHFVIFFNIKTSEWCSILFMDIEMNNYMIVFGEGERHHNGVVWHFNRDFFEAF